MWYCTTQMYKPSAPRSDRLTKDCSFWPMGTIVSAYEFLAATVIGQKAGKWAGLSMLGCMFEYDWRCVICFPPKRRHYVDANANTDFYNCSLCVTVFSLKSVRMWNVILRVEHTGGEGGRRTWYLVLPPWPLATPWWCPVGWETTRRRVEERRPHLTQTQAVTAGLGGENVSLVGGILLLGCLRGLSVK